MTVTFLCLQCGKYPRLVLWGKQLRVCTYCANKNLYKAIFSNWEDEDETNTRYSNDVDRPVS